MRGRIIMWTGVTFVGILGIGLLIWVSQQGYVGLHGKAKHLLGLGKHAFAHDRLPDAQVHLEELIGTFPESPWTDEALLVLGQVYETQQQAIEAQAIYRLLLEQFPSSPLVEETQTRLGRVNVDVLFSPTVTDLDGMHEVQPGDTLGEIASANHTTIELIKRANGLAGDTIYPRQKLKVSTGRFRLRVDKSQNQLLLTKEEQFVKLYAVATGKNNSTPVGTFTIVNKVVDPPWYRLGAVVPPDSPENILGTRWMGISEEGYGIHGSVDPEAIGRQVTAGCVRMTRADVEELFTIVPVGTEVTIVD